MQQDICFIFAFGQSFFLILDIYLLKSLLRSCINQGMIQGVSEETIYFARSVAHNLSPKSNEQVNTRLTIANTYIGSVNNLTSKFRI